MYKLLAWWRAGAPHAWSSINLIGYIPDRVPTLSWSKKCSSMIKNYEINSWRGMINCFNDTHNAECIANMFLLTKFVSSLFWVAYVLFFVRASRTIWQRSRQDLVRESLLTIGKMRPVGLMTKIKNVPKPQKPQKYEGVKYHNQN